MTFDPANKYGGIHPDLTPKMQTERPTDDFDVVAYLHLGLRRNGAMSITGNIGDLAVSIGMLESALDVLRRRVPNGTLIVPETDLAIPQPVYPLGE